MCSRNRGCWKRKKVVSPVLSPVVTRCRVDDGVENDETGEEDTVRSVVSLIGEYCYDLMGWYTSGKCFMNARWLDTHSSLRHSVERRNRLVPDVPKVFYRPRGYRHSTISDGFVFVVSTKSRANGNTTRRFGLPVALVG